MQINKTMLNMTCTLYNVTGRSADRKPIYDDGTSLSNVWLDFQNGQANGSYGKESTDTMTLYYDCVNSSPLSVSFLKGQKVAFNGTDYTVNTIKPCYGLNGLEHYELGLV